MTRAIPQADSATPVDPSHLIAVFDPASNAPLAQSIGDVVRSVFTQAIQDSIPQAQVIVAFAATSAGAQSGAAQAQAASYTGEWVVNLTLTEAGPRPGFELPAGRSLLSVWVDGVDLRADFDISGNNQRYVLDRDWGAGPFEMRVRTEAGGA